MINPPSPKAPIRSTIRQCHGVNWNDEYAWLRDPKFPEVEDPEILAYLEAENRYSEEWFGHRAELVESFFREFKGRIKEDESSVPARDGLFEYFWRFEPGAQYRVWARRRLDGSRAEQTIVDETKLAEQQSYFRLRSIAISSDAKLLGKSYDNDGSERFRIDVTKIGCAAKLTETITNTSGELVWNSWGEAIYYVELNEQLRPYRVKCRNIQLRDQQDETIYVENDPGFFVSIGRTNDRRYLTIHTGDHVTSEVRIVDLTKANSSVRLVAERREGHRYSIDHAHGEFFILTNDLHENYRVAKVSAEQLDERFWKDEIRGSAAHYLTRLECFSDFLVITERVSGQSQIRIRVYGGTEHRIDFGEEVFAVGLGENREFRTDLLRVVFSSPITPTTVFDYDVAEQQLVLRRVKEIPSGYDPERYRCHRLWAQTEDDKSVPVTVVSHADTAIDGTAPLILYGYGSYGMGLEPSFNTNRISLLDRGFIWAIAHVRGGDELGHGWYQDGKLRKKTNTFKDFIACAETLICKKYTDHGMIAIMGGSAGGMLVGAAINMRPEFWGCAVALVPFVDVLNTMLDAQLPLTPIEWPEWGNPIENVEDFRYIRSYSPYDNVMNQVFPPMFVTAGISDPRVTYWEPAKWVARLRANNCGDGPILLKTNMGAGHFGVSGRFEALRELAQIYTFIVTTVGVGGRRA